MFKRACWALALAVLLAVPVVVQAQGDYLDVYFVKVKPEKIGEFNTIAKKVVEANRRNNGDRWVATETMYGEGDTFAFVSTRQDYAQIENAYGAFMGALQKAYGKEGAEKMLHDWENCLAASRSELRLRRRDLSVRAPADAAAELRFIGGSRVVRTITVHARPGKAAELEALLKETKTAAEQAANTQPVLVSQVIEGSKGTTFYISTFRSSLGGFDKNPTLRNILGEEGFKRHLQEVAECIQSSESALSRFSPELSNPPEELVAAAPDFWQPKTGTTVAAAKAKPKAPGMKATSEKQKQ